MPRSIRYFILIWGCLLLSSMPLSAQGSRWRDTLQQKITLLQELKSASNYEQAQIEAANLRAFMRQQYITCPPNAVSLISGIYLKNKDVVNGNLFLDETEQAARRDRNMSNREALFAALVREHERWGQSERAATASQLLKTTQDSLSAIRVRTQTSRLQQITDSLRLELIRAQTQQVDSVSMPQNQFWGIMAAFAVALLGLLWFLNRSNQRWQDRLEQAERHHDLQMANLRPPVHIAPSDMTDVAQVATGTSAYFTQRKEGPTFGDGLPPALALVVEPNRHVAIYVRSLLSNHYDVEMASTAAEALKMANELLPDIIVCDTQLNGVTGIEVTRQIKLSDRTNHIPVIILSRFFGNDGKLDALRAGADAWFTRPMLNDEFDAAVQQLMIQQKALHEQFDRYLQLYYSGNRQPQNNRFLEEIIRHIESRMADVDLMPDELARLMQMTNPHFNKKVRALTGKDPGQIIREVRLEKAKFLLQNRAGTPQAISAMVGYNSPGTFALAFKDYFGEHTLLLQ
jgi:CheY-like chemotaxis protein